MKPLEDVRQFLNNIEVEYIYYINFCVVKIPISRFLYESDLRVSIFSSLKNKIHIRIHIFFLNSQSSIVRIVSRIRVIVFNRF